MQLIPDLPIGRFPVTTLAEAQIVVGKTVAHLTAALMGVWRSRALIVADNDYQLDGTPDPQAPVPYLWYLYDADSRRNGSKLPILLSMTCLSGDFAGGIRWLEA